MFYSNKSIYTGATINRWVSGCCLTPTQQYKCAAI
jgi:hypothetical protein